MGRFTRDPVEIARIRDVSLALVGHSIFKITLLTGMVLEGVLRAQQTGNNGGEGRVWYYHGDFTIQTLDNQWFSIDCCDVAQVESVWELRRDAYAAAGLLTIASGPAGA